MTCYVESSAAMKLLVGEAETLALKHLLDGARDDGERIVAIPLLETELRRAAVRLDLSQEDVTATLARFTIIDVDRAMFRAAGVLPGQHLRSLDALHVAGALRAGVTTFVTYDDRQREAALAVGLTVGAPA